MLFAVRRQQPIITFEFDATDDDDEQEMDETNGEMETKDGKADEKERLSPEKISPKIELLRSTSIKTDQISILPAFH